MSAMRLGTRESSYESLLTRSGQGPAILNPASIIVGGALQNKIYLWLPIGATLNGYEASGSGLQAALDAAVTGSTIALPSAQIDLIAPLTLPAGVALQGLSRNSVLAFSGFSGTALVLGEDAVAEYFVLTFVATGAQAIGIDATARGTRINAVDVTVSGGSSSNVGKLIGFATTPPPGAALLDFSVDDNSMYLGMML